MNLQKGVACGRVWLGAARVRVHHKLISLCFEDGGVRLWSPHGEEAGEGATGRGGEAAGESRGAERREGNAARPAKDKV